MPARSTVITEVSKTIQGERQILRTSQVLQMAGRAGRRGIDNEGHVVIMRNQRESMSVAHRLLVSSIENIESQFRATYAMCLNMLQGKASIELCKEVILKSFGSFVRNNQRKPKFQM
jgi:superfamily II RNA helicase